MHEAKTHLSEYLNRVAYRGERILVERHGKPVAALVSVEDLRRLEAQDEQVTSVDNLDAKEALFRRLAAESGIVIHYPTDERDPFDDFVPLKIEGRPLSEQIIDERR